jgi:excisionase family DNA binding protein
MSRRPEKPYSPPASRKSATKLDVAHEYGVSLRTVDTWIYEKKIPYKKLGPRLIRFDLDRVAAALERYTVEEIR